VLDRELDTNLVFEKRIEATTTTKNDNNDNNQKEEGESRELSKYGRALRQRSSLVPVYITGICTAHLNVEEMKKVLKNFILLIANDVNHWNMSHQDVLVSAFSLLARQWEEWIEVEITLLWDLIVHSSPLVRAVVVKLFSLVTRFLDEKAIASKILPALITLSSDMSQEVRFATVSAFSELAGATENKTMLDKVTLQLETMTQGGDRKINREMVVEFSKIIPQVNAAFRDEFILKHLLQCAKSISTTKSVKKQQKMVKVLLPAYSAIFSCITSLQVKSEYILPGLNAVLDVESILDARDKKSVRDMIHDLKATMEGGNDNVSTTPTNTTLPSAEEISQKKEEVVSALGELSSRFGSWWAEKG